MILALLLALASPLSAAELSKTDQDVVAYVVKTDVPDMDPVLVRRFLELDLSSVKPQKRRKEAELKKLAIQVALKLHQARPIGPTRTPERCSWPASKRSRAMSWIASRRAPSAPRKT
jgi:hypothetical protein